MDFARRATQDTRNPVLKESDLAFVLHASPQTMTNWKARGVSKLGALAAERQFGVSSLWVLDGTGDERSSLKPNARSGTYDSLIDDLKELLPEELEELRAQIHDRAEYARKIRRHSPEAIPNKPKSAA